VSTVPVSVVIDLRRQIAHLEAALNAAKALLADPLVTACIASAREKDKGDDTGIQEDEADCERLAAKADAFDRAVIAIQAPAMRRP
jgi:hypothetical protein